METKDLTYEEFYDEIEDAMCTCFDGDEKAEKIVQDIYANPKGRSEDELVKDAMNSLSKYLETQEKYGEKLEKEQAWFEKNKDINFAKSDTFYAFHKLQQVHAAYKKGEKIEFPEYGKGYEKVPKRGDVFVCVIKFLNSDLPSALFSAIMRSTFDIEKNNDVEKDNPEEVDKQDTDNNAPNDTDIPDDNNEINDSDVSENEIEPNDIETSEDKEESADTEQLQNDDNLNDIDSSKNEDSPNDVEQLGNEDESRDIEVPENEEKSDEIEAFRDEDDTNDTEVSENEDNSDDTDTPEEESGLNDIEQFEDDGNFDDTQTPEDETESYDTDASEDEGESKDIESPESDGGADDTEKPEDEDESQDTEKSEDDTDNTDSERDSNDVESSEDEGENADAEKSEDEGEPEDVEAFENEDANESEDTEKSEKESNENANSDDTSKSEVRNEEGKEAAVELKEDLVASDGKGNGIDGAVDAKTVEKTEDKSEISSVDPKDAVEGSNEKTEITESKDLSEIAPIDAKSAAIGDGAVDVASGSDTKDIEEDKETDEDREDFKEKCVETFNDIFNEFLSVGEGFLHPSDTDDMTHILDAILEEKLGELTTFYDSLPNLEPGTDTASAISEAYMESLSTQIVEKVDLGQDLNTLIEVGGAEILEGISSYFGADVSYEVGDMLSAQVSDLEISTDLADAIDSSIVGAYQMETEFPSQIEIGDFLIDNGVLKDVESGELVAGFPNDLSADTSIEQIMSGLEDTFNDIEYVEPIEIEVTPAIDFVDHHNNDTDFNDIDALYEANNGMFETDLSFDDDLLMDLEPNKDIEIPDTDFDLEEDLDWNDFVSAGE